jgi:hypothetical protein
MTVWIVQTDRRRDYSAAEEFGEVKEVFSSIGRNFSPQAAIEHARRVLSKMQDDDYILMAGDYALCAICVTVASERNDVCNVLRWDKNKLSYDAIPLKF